MAAASEESVGARVGQHFRISWMLRWFTERLAMSAAPSTPFGRPALACAVIAGLCWSLFFYYGAHISYSGDDFTILRPLFGEGLGQSLQRTFRPLEYAVAALSKAANFPVWLFASALAYIGTALGTLALLRLTSARPIPLWQIFICASTPLAANTYFQIDTVSQAFANLFSLLLAIETTRCIQAADAVRTARRAWIVAALAVLCLASKETTYGLVTLACALLLLSKGRQVWKPLAVIALALVLCLSWGVFISLHLDAAAREHYGLKNPVYWLFAIVFSLTVAVAPVPTSLVLTGTASQHAGFLALVVFGVATSLAAICVYYGPALRRWRERHARSVEPTTVLLVLFLFASLVPSMFLKAGELYASQCLPYLKCLLLPRYSTPRGAAPAVLGWVVGSLWLVASSVNLMFVSVHTGYRASAQESVPFAQRPTAVLEEIVPRQRRSYSIYSMPSVGKEEGECRISRADRSICLPKDIMSGFPHRQ
ncbi:MAG: hypothetical protein ABW110_05420 [Steroidobacteraceae bacterium]